MNPDQPTRSQAINALAYYVRAIRPTWDTPGIIAALRDLGDIPLDQVGIAAIRYATDELNLTPTNLANVNNRAWDDDWHPPCPIHPGYRGRRTDGECGLCYADRNADPDSYARFSRRPPDAETRAQLLAALHPEQERDRERATSVPATTVTEP